MNHSSERASIWGSTLLTRMPVSPGGSLWFQSRHSCQFSLSYSPTPKALSSAPQGPPSTPTLLGSLLSLSLSPPCLASSSSSRCRDVNFTADIFFYAGPRAQRLSRSHLPPLFQSKWLSFVGKILLHFKNPLKLSKI